MPVYFKLGSEFMPPLREGSLLYMPSAVQPGMSVAEAEKALQVQDKILMSFPEVERVFGKAGRAGTSTDPAPFTMMETTILLKPESQWREKPRWYSGWAPEWLKRVLRTAWRDRITQEELDRRDGRGLAPARDQQRLDHAHQGPAGHAVDRHSHARRHQDERRGLDVIRRSDGGRGRHPEVPDTRSVYAERVAGGYFLDFVLNRDKLARYGLSVDDANMMVMTAVGGDNQTTTIEGRERYGVNVRYARDFRDDVDALARVLLPLPGGPGPDPDGGDRGGRARRRARR